VRFKAVRINIRVFHRLQSCS